MQRCIQKSIALDRLTTWQLINSADACTRSGLIHASNYNIGLHLTNADSIIDRFPDAVDQLAEPDSQEAQADVAAM
jgi:hypothetical protein